MEKLIARVKFGRKPGITITEAGEEFEVDSEYAKQLVKLNFASYVKQEKPKEVEKELKKEATTKELKAPVKTKEAKAPVKTKAKKAK